MDLLTNSQIIAAAAKELKRRREARKDAVAFSEYVPVPGRPEGSELTPKHVRLILEAGQRCIERDNGRLMLLMPPGCAKSTMGSVVLPSYLAGRNPNTQVILGSYATSLARKHGRRARSLVKSEEFYRVFKTRLTRHSSAANHWILDNGSEYMAAGMLSGVTGNRGHLIIIDDPVRGRKDAESVVKRIATLQAYEDDFLTRMFPNASVIIIQTRWAKNDLAGSILPEDWNGESGLIECRDGMEWEVLCLQAKCERRDDPLGREIGEYIWKEWFSKEHWRQFEKNARTWGSLYQQIPTPLEGGVFKGNWLIPYEEHPKNIIWFISTDFAVSVEKGDFTEFGVFGVCPDGDIWIEDWWSGQTSADIWIDALLDLVHKYNPLATFGESGVIRRAVEPYLKKRMIERRTYTRLEWLTRSENKEDVLIRAVGFQAIAASGRVHYRAGTEWGAALVNQLSIFPSPPDDKVDVCGLLGMAIDEAHPAIRDAVKQITEEFIPRINKQRAQSWRKK